MKSGNKSIRVDLRKPLKVEQVESNGVSLSDIHRKNGNKYSPNFWKYLNENGVQATIGRVYRDKDGVLWYGYEDAPFMCVARLMQILCQGVKAQAAVYSNLGDLEEVKDFWPRYLEVGRCAIDPSHNHQFIDVNRYVEHGESRKCLWCGQHQDLHKFKVEVEREEWRDVSTPEMAEINPQ